jgi:hypothetical protein
MSDPTFILTIKHKEITDLPIIHQSTKQANI